MILSDALRQAAAKFIRPSSLHAIAACPARPLTEAATVATVGEPAESPEASMGHRAHAFVADAINNWKLSQETGEHGACWGDTIALARNDAAADGLDAWTVRCIQFCLETARDLIAKYEIYPENALVEHRLDMTDLGMSGGTADLILVEPFERVIVIDWKFTFMDQGDATEHDQLQAYAASAAVTFRTPEVIVYLVAPRADKDNRVTSAKFDADALRENATWTRAVVARATSERPELRASHDACIYCRALATCPAARKYIMDAHEALAVLGNPTTADDLGELANAAKLAEKFAESGKETVKAELIAGNPATGWKLGAPRAIRSVVGVADALAEMEAAGIKATDLAQADALSIKVGNLPDAAASIIAARITEKLSSPSLTQDKRGRAA